MTEEQLTVGSYELRNCIATGNATQIWEVGEAGAPMQLAMKLLLDDAHKVPAQKNTLKHEFKVGSSLDHPGLVRFHSIEVNRDHGFFIMDFVRAPSLKAQFSMNMPLMQAGLGKMAESLCRTFQYMHDQGWLHRDIKPDNIMVSKSGETKVIDFSLSAKIKSGIGKMFAGKQAIRGTRNYIAPETILKKPADQRTDIYSLGVTLYELVTGQLPFAGETPNDLLRKHLSEKATLPSNINPNCTVELDGVIMKMLEKNPATRFQAMQEVGAAFRGLKCWNEDPLKLHEDMMREEKEQRAQSVDKRLDSRADAERTAKGISAPAKEKKKKKPSARVLREEARRKAQKQDQAAEPAAEPAAPAAPVPGVMPGYGMPGQPMPGQMYPGQPMPGQPMPGQPMPGQMYPGQPMPGQPMPGQMYPGQPMPGQPMPGQMYPGQPMPGQMYPGQPMPGQPVPGQVYPGQPVPGQPMPGQVMPGQPVAGQPVPGQVMPGQPVAGQPVPGQVMPGQPVPGQPAAPQPPADSSGPTDATEEDVQGLMDMIE